MPHKIKSHKEDNSFFKRFVEKHPYPVLRIDKQYTVVYANPASLPILLEWGIEVGDIIPTDIQNTIAPSVKNPNIATALELKCGENILVLNVTSNLDDSTIDVIGHDETAQRAIQKELEITNKEAQDATKAKANFLANMSHEIRTPMNGVIGICNLLLTEVSDTKVLDQLRLIQSCGNSMLDIINDILDFSKIEAGKIEIENVPFDFHSMVSEVIQLLDSRAREKNLAIQYNVASKEQCWIYGDSTKLRQVVANLLNNAIKFTQRGSISIQCETRMLDSKRTQIHFLIQDTGIGMTNEQLSKLFHSFSQADVSTTRRFGGSGLGLAICKGLVEKMGGKIGVESILGQGSTFHFQIEFKGAEAIEAKETSSTLQFDVTLGEKHPLKVLVAEDNRVNQIVISKLLEKLGYNTDIAATGREVIEAVQTKHYDIIFLDLHMPEMDGFETAEFLTKTLPRESLPYLCALTASTLKEDIDRCQQIGIHEFIAKPIQVSELIRVISLAAGITPTVQSKFISKKSPSKESSFDEAALLHNFEGIEHVLPETIETFQNFKSNYLKSIRSAIEQKNAASLGSAAHALKGGVSNFFATRSRELAHQLESAGRKGNLKNCDVLYSELVTEVERLSQELASWKYSKKRSA